MRVVFGLVFLILIPGAGKAFYWSILSFYNDKDIFYPVLGGFIAGLIGWKIFVKRWSWFNTFEHELTHAIVALMFFRKIKEFKVTRSDGGYIAHVGTFGGTFGSEMIGLAPYFLPTFSLILVLISPLIPIDMHKWFIPLIGFTLAYHTFSTIQETDIIQPDLNSRGLIYSAVVVISMTMIIHSLLITILVNGYSGVVEWWQVVLDTTCDMFGWMKAKVV